MYTVQWWLQLYQKLMAASWSTIVVTPVAPCALTRWWGVRPRSMADPLRTPPPIPKSSTPPLPLIFYPCFSSFAWHSIQRWIYPDEKEFWKLMLILNIAYWWSKRIKKPGEGREGLLSKWFKMEVKHPLYGLFKEAGREVGSVFIIHPGSFPNFRRSESAFQPLAPQFLLSHKALRWDFRTWTTRPLPTHATSDTKIAEWRRKGAGWREKGRKGEGK